MWRCLRTWFHLQVVAKPLQGCAALPLENNIGVWHGNVEWPGKFLGRCLPDEDLGTSFVKARYHVHSANFQKQRYHCSIYLQMTETSLCVAR